MSNTIGERVNEIIEIKDAEILRLSEKFREASARVTELESEIKLWHDTLDGTVHSTCHVMRLMEKVIGGNDE
jgi:hypothetical protein